LESTYSRRWRPGQTVQLISNGVVIHDMCLLKIRIFMWFLNRKEILTKDNRAKRN
jgi:hypothetical protein